MLNGDGYGTSLDIWSAGVIMYILLSGFPPFTNDKKKPRVGHNVTHSSSSSSSSSSRTSAAHHAPVDMYTKIRAGSFAFPAPVWDSVSDDAKDLITRMLTVDPDQRIQAREALRHPWMRAHRQSLGIDVDDDDGGTGDDDNCGGSGGGSNSRGGGSDAPTATPSPRSQALFTRFNDTRKRKLGTVSSAADT
jgi:serine/threonine protein kinase